MIEIIECEQRSPQWYDARRGIPTASKFSVVLAKAIDRKSPSVTRAKYMRQLAGEIITGEPTLETFSNNHMERGKEKEAIAREMYGFTWADGPLRQVGFIRNGRKGCSPDSLVGDDGMLEIKCCLTDIYIEATLRDEGDPPPEYVAQCQGGLWVADRQYIDLAIYNEKMGLHVVRIQRNEEKIAELRRAITAFNAELDELVARIRARAAA